MNPFRIRIFIFCVSALNSSIIIAQTSMRSEEGIKLYSGGIYALSSSQAEGGHTTSSSSGIELQFEIFRKDVDLRSPEAFSLFSNVTQLLNQQPPQIQFGVRTSKELNLRAINFALNLEMDSNQWRESEDGAKFAEAQGAGPINRHQLQYRANLGSRFKLTERSEVRVEASASRQLHYVRGDKLKHLAGLKYEMSSSLNHELTFSRSYLVGKDVGFGVENETIKVLDFISNLKLGEIQKVRCNVGLGEVHATARSAQRFYAGGCFAERTGSVFSEVIEMTRSVDKDFFSGDFIEIDKLGIGLYQNLGFKDRLNYFLAYVIDRDVGGQFWGNKKRLDTTLSFLTEWDSLKTKLGVQNTYAVTSFKWGFENTGFKRQSQVYQIGLGAKF